MMANGRNPAARDGMEAQMRTYYVQVQDTQGNWIQGARRYLSNRKAHTAARAVKDRPARVNMVLEKSKLRMPI